MKRDKFFPASLSKGDEIRVISPARSMGIISDSVRDLAITRLNDLGLKVSFSKHCTELDRFGSSSVNSRLQDIHDAFADPGVKANCAWIGKS